MLLRKSSVIFCLRLRAYSYNYIQIGSLIYEQIIWNNKMGLYTIDWIIQLVAQAPLVFCIPVTGLLLTLLIKFTTENSLK